MTLGTSGKLVEAELSRVMRDSYGKLLGLLASRTRDVAGAEDALAQSLAAASSRWPLFGIPASPEGWLLAVARRRAIDADRHDRPTGALLERQWAEPAGAEVQGESAALVPDRRLELMLLCAHPAIEESVRAPLMLQAVLGIDSARIARAFLVSPAAMAQRLVRAKSKIRLAGIKFELPEREHIPGRLPALLDAIYAAYAQGWSGPPDGRPDPGGLAIEAIWLGALLVKLVPQQAEALGLLALMLYLQARNAARRSTEGDFVALSQQDMRRWDHALIDEADDLLARAAEHRLAGRYQLEAAIQSAHSHRRIAGEPDWSAIDLLYAQLHRITGSPVVAVNHALVRARLAGAPAGLAALDEIGCDQRLADFQPYWSAKAELLSQLGDTQGANDAYDRAILLSSDEAARQYLRARRADQRRPRGQPGLIWQGALERSAVDPFSTG